MVFTASKRLLILKFLFANLTISLCSCGSSGCLKNLIHLTLLFSYPLNKWSSMKYIIAVNSDWLGPLVITKVSVLPLQKKKKKKDSTCRPFSYSAGVRHLFYIYIFFLVMFVVLISIEPFGCTFQY